MAALRDEHEPPMLGVGVRVLFRRLGFRKRPISVPLKEYAVAHPVPASRPKYAVPFGMTAGVPATIGTAETQARRTALKSVNIVLSRIG